MQAFANNNQATRKNLLKVFSGPHLGAEILLSNGGYDIGRSEDCAIVLQDETVVGKHARISIDNGEIVLERLGDAEVMVDGQPLDVESPIYLRPYQTATLGTTHFAIGEPGGAWSTVTLPQPMHAAEQRVSQVQDAGLLSRVLAALGLQAYSASLEPLQQGLRNLTQSPLANKIGLSRISEGLSKRVQVLFDDPDSEYRPSQNSAVAAAAVPADTELPVTEKTGRTLFSPITSLAAATLLGITISLTPIVFSNSGVKGVDTNLQQLQLANAALVELELSGVTASSISKDEVLIEGYVKRPADKQLLQNRLQERGVTARFKLKTGSGLVESTQSLLNVLGYSSLQVTYQPHGEVAVQGYVSNKADWQSVKTALLEDIAGLQAVNDSALQDLAGRQQTLKTYLQAHDLTNKLSVTAAADTNTLTVAGILSGPEIDRWQQVLQQFRGQYGDSPIIQSNINDTHDVVDLDIKAVQGEGDLHYLITAEDVMYMEGSLLPNGFVVKSIDVNQIVLAKGEIEAVYTLSE